MKKVLLSILTLLYLGVSSGVAMEIHYCMGERTGADLFSHNDDKCGRCGMTEKKGGCCNDELRFYKLTDEHKNVTPDHSLFLSIVLPDLLPVTDHIIYSYQRTLPVAFPPPDTGPPIYILNCIFRI